MFADRVARLRSQFFGIERMDRTADGQVLPRRYFDSAASCLMLKAAYECAAQFLPHYANTHSGLHFAACASTLTYAWAHDQVLSFLGASPDEYVCVFAGNGSTACLNRLARALSESRPERSTVLVSLMEHHSNDLPHRRYHEHVVHVPCAGRGRALSGSCLEELERLLIEHRGRVNYVAVTGASNVTGILNPIAKIAKLAHAHDALVVVDGSQLLAHSSFRMTSDIDAFVFSGHKAYVPGSPGVMVVKKGLLERLGPVEFGGGMVDHVWKDTFRVQNAVQEREEAGTPNIYGAVMLGFGLELLREIGMRHIVEHEQILLRQLIEGLREIEGVSLYGSLDLERHPRVGIVTFNVKGLDHALVAAILNDYFNIAVRNECFCAHPYVRELLVEDLWDLDVGDDVLDEEFVKRKQGMVRASLGIYNTEEDVNCLIHAVKHVAERRVEYENAYRLDASGAYVNKTFAYAVESQFLPKQTFDTWVQACLGAPA